MNNLHLRIAALALLSTLAGNGQYIFAELTGTRQVLMRGKLLRCERVEIGLDYELRCYGGSPPYETLIEALSFTNLITLLGALDSDLPTLPAKAPPKREISSSRFFTATMNLYSATGDFNGDGILDSATPPRSGSSMTLRIGRPNNSFEADRLLPAGGDPRTVVASDLNADGFPDFIVGHFRGISIIAATGRSTYAAARELPAGGRVDSLFVADFNNDSLPDIAGILRDKKEVLIFLNTGSGNFAAPSRLALPEDAEYIVAGDLNVDGRSDLILATVPTSRNLLMTALNSGNGGFAAVQTSPLPEVPSYLAVTDTDGDNRLDAIVKLSNGLTSIHAGNGAGLFTRRSVHGGGFGFKTGFDFVDDGVSRRFLIYPGSGEYTLVADAFKPDGSLNSVAGVGFPGFARSVRVADLNGDSQPDIIAAGDGTFGRVGGLWVRLRSGQDYTSAALIGNIKPNAIEVADLNGDNRPDIIALESTGNGATCSILINNGNGGFAAPVRIWDQPTNDFVVYRLLAGDFNNDKRTDIVLVGSNAIHALVSSGNGAFRPAVNLAAPNGVLNAILGDINSDGLSDLMVMTGTGLSVRNGRRPVLVQYLAQADGSFRAPTDVLTVAIPDASSSILAITDLNNDKIPDIVYSVVPQLSFDTVRIQLGQAGGGYREGTVFGGINNLLFHDADGDGTVDAINSSNAGNLNFYRGRGDGSFGNALTIPGGGSIIPVQLNDDKKTDFAVLVPGAETFVLLLPSNFPAQNNATVVSAASSQSIPAAPNSIVTVYGIGLATSTASTESVTWSESLAGTTARIRDALGNSYPARLAFVSPSQVNLLIPAEVYPEDTNITASVQIASGSGTLSTGPVAIRRVSPSVFMAGPNLAAANVLRVRAGVQTVEAVVTVENGQLVPNPIDLGPDGDQIFLLLYGTGIRNRIALNQVTATVGGVNAPVAFAGNQGQFPGVDQINVQIPRSLAGRGGVDIVLRVSGIEANPVRIAIR